MALTVVLLALGVFAVVNLMKLFGPPALLPAAKLTLAAAMSIMLTVVYAADVQQGVPMAMGMFGLSTVFHGLHKLLEAAGDAKRSETLSMRR